LESSIEGARGILLNISGGSDLGLLEVNDAAEVVHSVAHPDANIIFGAVVDDAMGDEVRVTVIAAGFDRTDGRRTNAAVENTAPPAEDSEVETPRRQVRAADIFGDDEDDDDLDLGGDDDDFDVPSFLR
jgi:cell division protein FtsZ